MHSVSVLLPTIRNDDWLDQAVNSVLASKDIEVELIVIFDGIKPDLNKSWVKDSRVVVLSLEDRKGLPSALMAGVKISKNEFLARLDHDDIAFPNRLLLQANYLETNKKCILVGSQLIGINEQSSELSQISYPAGHDIRKHLLFQNAVPHPGAMLRKSALLVAGGYDPTLSNMEDYDLWLRMALIGEIANLDLPLTYYRIHSSQMSKGADPRGLYVRKIINRRKTLNKFLGKNQLGQFTRDFIWLSVQYLRYLGIIRPGYIRQATSKRA